MVLKKKFVKTCSSLMLLILSFNCNKVFAINNEEIQNEIDSNNKVIEELEKEILPYRDKPTLYFNIYRQLISVSEI